MLKKHLLALLLIVSGSSMAAVETTGMGKIEQAMGHVVPNCRVVAHRENATGAVRYFRIQEVAGEDDVAAVVLSALMANRDTTISFDPAVTTGCGSEPRIQYITVY